MKKLAFIFLFIPVLLQAQIVSKSQKLKEVYKETIKENEHKRIYNFKTTAFRKWSSDMASVLLEGAINLYAHAYSDRSNVTFYAENDFPATYALTKIKKTYVVQKEGSNRYYGIYNSIQFKKYFLPLIADDKALYKTILEMNKSDWIEHLPSFIKAYNKKKE